MFPTELINRKQWLLWKFEKHENEKKPRKVPYYANGQRRAGKQGEQSDLNNLTTYSQASSVLEFGDYDGLGFAFLPNDGLIGIDIDDKADRDPDLAKKIITGLNSYTELSPSGKGHHIFVLGNTKTFKDNNIGIEVFCNSQFFTMTGNHVKDTPFSINQISEKALNRLREIVKPTIAKPKPQPQVQTTNERAKVESALAYINADCGYDEWYKIGAAIYSEFGASGFSIWDYWSSKSSKYNNKGMYEKYLSFANIHDVTIATVFRMAIDNGWQPPRDPNYKPQPQVQAQAPKAPTATDPQISIDIFSPLIDVTDKGKPLSTIENMAEILRRIGAIVRYNVISKQIEVLLQGESFSLDNKNNASLAHLISWVNRFGMATGNIQDFVCAIADKNLYNPVANWITSKKWDGVSRFTEFCDTITEAQTRTLSDGRKLKDILIMRWMISAIAAAFNPDGVSAHGVLVLQGEQNLGKTSWLKSLVPDSLGVVKDGLTLNPSDKDSVMLCVRNWIVELGELDATFRKADISNLKSFIPADRDVLRRPYARLESEFARRTVFFASVNPKQFLHDNTGNRRYWVIECKKINSRHGIDMQQLWAEIYENLYKKGISHFLDKDENEALNENNENYMSITPCVELCEESFQWSKQPSQLLTATEIAILSGIERPTKGDINEIAEYIRQKHQISQKADPKTKSKKFYMPPITFEAEKRMNKK